MSVIERIPRERDPERIAKMMDLGNHRCRTVEDFFHLHCYAHLQQTWDGVQLLKSSLDLLRYWTLLSELRPHAVVETGVQHGGSSLFFMDALGVLCGPDAVYLGIDIDMPLHDRVLGRLREEDAQPAILLKNDCLAPETVEQVRGVLSRAAPEGELPRVLFVLDSVHSEAHVAEELRLYAPLVPVGSYLVVEDTDHGGRPVLAGYTPSAYDAVRKFLATSAQFENDTRLDTLAGVSNCNGAWLKRTA